MARQVLACDVGGTKTDLALYRVDAARAPVPVIEGTLSSQAYADLESLVAEFLAGVEEPIAAAAFGIAGPVVDGEVRVTNLPWKVEAPALAAAIGCERVRLLNDLETSAYGALHLPQESLLTLNEGVARRSHAAVIAAGTGLGQAVLFFDGERHRPVGTEGGHTLFAPRDEREQRLLRFLAERFGRVSWERVVSGPGLRNIFDFLVADGRTPAPEVVERMEGGDPSAVIGAAGLERRCPTSREAVELFVELYGAQAANLALSVMSLGGMYVGGGIVTRLLPVVREGHFLRAFRQGGRFSALLEEIPVRVILDPQTSLRGAAAIAFEMCDPASGQGGA